MSSAWWHTVLPPASAIPTVATTFLYSESSSYHSMDSSMAGTVGVVGGTSLAAMAAFAATYFLYRRPRPVHIPVDLDHQATSDQGTYKSHLTEGDNFLEYLFEDARTLYEAMQRGLRISRHKQCLGWRTRADEPYRWLTYGEVDTRIRNFASGLVQLGATPGPDAFIGIYSQNCCEWVITEHACFSQSIVTVPLYDTLGPTACTHIVNQANIRIIVCDKTTRVENLLNEITLTPSLQKIVSMEVTDDARQRAKEAGVELLLFSEVEALGVKHPSEAKPPRPADLATVCYTSGTTGQPKGVMLSHLNIISNVSAVSKQLGDKAPTQDDVMISFLPLAHMLERCCETSLYMVGGSVGFYRGEIKELMEDMKALRPTLSPCVPRLLNRIYDKVHARVQNSPFKKFLLKIAFRMKYSELQKFIVRNTSLWDWLVFRPVRQGMGGRLRLMVIGSAPIAGNVLTFIRCALGAVIVEGYGQTECTCPCTLTFPGDYVIGHVGPPLPCCEVRLVDVPEMEYWATRDQGEICVRGPIVFKGYFRDPERTAEVLDEDGWLHTGDIGTWLPNGTLRVIDRKKYIFKLSQGEYVAPEKIENICARSKFVAQIYIHGESLKSCLVAIVVPEEEFTRNWAKKHEPERFSHATWQEICHSKELKKAILEDLKSLANEAGLNSFEQVKDIYIHDQIMSIENGLLTPTLKTKRNEAFKQFKSKIEAMYTQLA